MMSESGGGLLIIGAGGHAKVVLAAARLEKRFECFAILDEDSANWGTCVQGTEVVGGCDLLTRLNSDEWHAVIAVGDNETRRRFAQQATQIGWRFACIFHPRAHIGEDVGIGEGTVILPQAVVNESSRIGRHVIVNSGAIVEHDCIIADYAHLAPGCCLTGRCEVGELAMIGARAAVLPGVRVGASAVVGAGAVVTHDVGVAEVVVGVPARPLRTSP